MANLISVQINGQANVENNLAKIESIVQQAYEKAKQDNNDEHTLVVLPECFSIFGVTGSEILLHAEKIGVGYIQQKLSEIARRFKCYLVAGTTPIVDENALRENKYYAASLVFSPSGKCIARYDKIHMFDVEVEDTTKSYKESRFTIAGEHLSLFKTPFAQVAQSVCYDLRFPEMFSAYSRYTLLGQAPDIIVVPSAFTYQTGSAHWHALLKARSIENQCYVVASNQVGTHFDKRETYGNSCIYSPWGECLSVLENEEGFAMATYNKAHIDAIRAKMPIRSHKKRDILLNANVVDNLLTQSGLDKQNLTQLLDLILDYKIDFADLYFQLSQHESWVLEDGIIKDGSYNIERGVGVRAITGEQTGFAYSDEISQQALSDACTAARSIAKSGGKTAGKAFSSSNNKALYTAKNPLLNMPDAEKVDLLKRVDIYVRKLAPEASQVSVSLSGVYEEILVAASDGTFATDIRPLIRLNCSVLLEKDGKRERGSSGAGGRRTYDFFEQTLSDGKLRFQRIADEAVHMARVNLRAIAAPAGSMPVVLGSGWPGVLLHEAVGHGLEGDFNRKGASTFSGKMGQQVASKGVTVVDDGTLDDRRGSLSIDDEGTPTQRNVLIEDGILTGYMQDKHNAGLMGVKPTGNGRRESYAHLPMPRMTNTYMLSGKHTPEEIISSVEKGIYAPNFGGGQVDITSGKFVFSTSEAYLIENGKITQPIKGATLIGNGPESMQKISMIGNDMSLDAGVGVCGKDGQSVPVGVGQPTLKVDEMTVGGTA